MRAGRSDSRRSLRTALSLLIPADRRFAAVTAVVGFDQTQDARRLGNAAAQHAPACEAGPNA
jgi:hypothetical protein